jgi:signal transduction histidine kinase
LNTKKNNILFVNSSKINNLLKSQYRSDQSLFDSEKDKSREMTEDKAKKLLQCWTHFECTKEKCPAYGSQKHCCWLMEGSLCHTELEENWIDKFDACINCEVFNHNLRDENRKQTLQFVSDHFKKYQGKIKIKQEALLSGKLKLEESIKENQKLLRELDKKNKELEFEKDHLEEKVAYRTEAMQQLHTKLMQSSKMAVIGRFSAGIAHEINNPLGAIINFTRMLKDEPDAKKDEQRFLELISKGLFRIENIVKQILGYSAFNESDIKSVNVNDLLKESLSFIHHELKDKEIQLVLKLEESIPEIPLNPAQIQQVFLNILKNAVHFLLPGGELEVKTKFDNNKIVLTFSDNGKGIKRSNVDKIFDPFFTTKEVGEGTGLGLFICHNIIKLYNGDICINSTENIGTEVIVSLPVPGE